MRLSALVCLLSAVSASPSGVEVIKDYHTEIGIPLATRIKAAEDEFFAKQNQNGSRIVGGWESPRHAHPYLAGLLITFFNNPGTSACGSSLISSDRLVTAAHCWAGGAIRAREFVVVLGSHFLFSGGTRIATNHVVLHPGWDVNMASLVNDVAVIYLPTHVEFTPQIQPVTLPRYMLWDSFVGEMAIAAGFGKTSDSQIGVSVNSFVSHVHVQVISVAQCQRVFGTNHVRHSTICTDGAGGIGICGGDSGGPLVVVRNDEHFLVGISSFVAASGCELGFPSAFARVTSFYNFIWQHL
ncbi:brachyurin-like [Maniola hyperantus]|uniref:brachyurin-like n=1 Tax=Aphantopus hyperantus TaxID=2795564 RepID=UPI001568FFBB|nr:brachyurin-like [Maniola hyperantus]